MFRAYLLSACILLTLLCAACSSTAAVFTGDNQPQQQPDAAPLMSSLALPPDQLQPWERVDSAGKVLATGDSPAGGSSRNASALNLESEFAAGVERYLDGGSATDNGEACTLSSIAGSPSYAIYRLPLGGRELGVATLDVNLLTGAGYYVGLGDYGRGHWQWFGPFSDSHVRLSASLAGDAGSSFVSALGNAFICVAVAEGAAVDVVGVGVNGRDDSDAEAPPVPTGLTITPAQNGVLIEWLPVSAGDLAGYRIYRNSQWFLDERGTGVRTVAGLEGLTSHLLVSAGATFVRVSAVDISGNESGLSEFVSAEPADGPGDASSYSVTAPSGGLNDSIDITAAGGDTYDYDVDGDGLYDITGTASTTAAVDTSATGVIRPHVRSYRAGMMTAQGGVSLLITGNSRPVASATAFPQSGPSPLEVGFTGLGEDAEDSVFDLQYAWDLDGDGTYEDNTNLLVLANEYFTPGIYGVKFRVTDTEGAWDVDTVPVLVIGLDPNNEPPIAFITVDRDRPRTGQRVVFNAALSDDPDGTVMLYEWDFDGDGAWDAQGESPTAAHTYVTQAGYDARVRVTDDKGGQAIAGVQLAVVHTPWSGFGRDTLHSRRSPYNGPLNDHLRWFYPGGDGILSSPAIGADGTIYFSCLDDKLYAIKPDGTLKWDFTTGGDLTSSPAAGADGTVYVGCYGDNTLWAIHGDGSLAWTYVTGDSIESSPTIGPDGTVYCGSNDGRLYAINPDGSLYWFYTAADRVASSAALGSDGTIYVGGYDNMLHAVNPDGSPKWQFPAGGDIDSSPAIGGDGTIYFGCLDFKLYAVHPDGTLAWTYETGDLVYPSPAIGSDGTIYVGSNDDKLYAIDPDGSLDWSYPTAGNVISSCAVAADGTLYFGSNDDSLYAIDAGGNFLWSSLTGGNMLSSPAIGADGTVYVGSADGNLRAFGP